MKPSRVETVLESILTTRWPAFVWGPPGVGKSSIVRKIAQDRKLALLDIRASLLEALANEGYTTESAETGRPGQIEEIAEVEVFRYAGGIAVEHDRGPLPAVRKIEVGQQQLAVVAQQLRVSQHGDGLR